MNIENILYGIELITMLLAVGSSVNKYKNSALVLKPTVWYLYFVLIEQVGIFSMLWSRYPKQNIFFIPHIGNVGETIILLLMYREIFKKYIADTNKYVYRKLFIILVVLFAAFAIVNAIYWQPITTYPSNTRTALFVIIILFSILFFHKYTYEPIPKSYRELPSYNASRVSLFWIIMGLLLYATLSLTRAIFTNIFLKELSKESYTNIVVADAIFSIILYVFLFIGFLKAKWLPKITWVEEQEEKKDIESPKTN